MVNPSTIIPPSSEEYTVHNSIGSSSHQMPPSSNKGCGRPLGSKNKPKIPLVINQDSDLALKPIFIQVPKNSDVIEAVVQFARHCQVSITVQCASGSILEATLCQTLPDTSTFVVFGPFTLISLTGTYINNNLSASSSSLSSPSNLDHNCSFTISFCSNFGQSFNGIVGGKVIAADDVTVVVTILKEL
uniref:PPC domain-containing protein n=1 Tax=Glycine max TaxID=3847 RepID=C6T3B0_SOYBN|nr:unknown [Glycine max]